MADRNGNRWRGLRFRELVSLNLQLAGLQHAAPRPPAPLRKPSEALSGDERPEQHSDILGVPGWHLTTHSDLRDRWSVHLDAAEQAAALTGAQHAAIVCYRKARPTSDAYVVMTLATWARLVLAAQHAEGVRS